MIRAGTLDDIDRVGDLMNRTYPEFVITAEGRRFVWARSYERDGTAWFAVDEGDTLVAWASTAREVDTSEPDVWWTNILVTEEARRQGHGGRLHDRVLEHAVAQGARAMTTQTTATDETRRFAAARGWTHTHTGRISAVDPRTVAPPTPEEGVEFVAFTEFADDPRPLYEIDMAVSKDIPSEFTFDTPFSEWFERWWKHPDIDYDVSAAVLVDGTPAGISMLRVDRATGRAGNDITGTLRAYRGRGLATALKRETLRRAAAVGVTFVVTANDATNAPMLRVNDRLGYQPFSEHLSWSKKLG